MANIKIKRSHAVAMLVALDFPKAGEWDDEKLASRLKQLTERITKDEIGEEFGELYEQLETLGGNDIEFTSSKAAEPEPDKEKDKEEKKPAAKPAAKDKSKPAVKDKDVKAKPAAKKTEAKKPAAKAAAKPAKKDKPVKKEVEKDEYGAEVGSAAHSINKHLPAKWATDIEVAESAGVKKRQARIRLRKLVKDGLLEKRRRVEYKLVDKKK